VQADAEATGSEVTSVRIWELFRERYSHPESAWQMHSYDLHREADKVQAQIRVGTDRDTIQLQGTGHGAIEALVDALQRQRGATVKVEAFDEHALGEGTEAEAMACVRIRFGETVATAVALAEDTTSASLQAVLTAVGKAVEFGAEEPVAGQA